MTPPGNMGFYDFAYLIDEVKTLVLCLIKFSFKRSPLRRGNLKSEMNWTVLLSRNKLILERLFLVP